jgi:CBS domain-containing protein
MNFSPLSQRPPGGEEEAPALQAAQVMRLVAPLYPGTTLARALHAFRDQAVPCLPVVEHGHLLGWITGERMAATIAADPAVVDTRTVDDLIELPPVLVSPVAPLETLIPLFEDACVSFLPVATPGGLYLGCLDRTDVATALAGRLVPPRVGGMATPLGVYLTTGAVSGGVGALGLVLAGMAMAIMLWLAEKLVQVGTALLYHAFHWTLARELFLALLDGGEDGSTLAPLPFFWVSLLASLLLSVVFFLFLRFAPRMAGYHAAEHQTVNAMEAGEPLLPEVVARMPRVHPRCGTNLWAVMSLSLLGMGVLATLLSTLVGRANLGAVALFATVSVFLILLNWRRVGGFLQQYCTTRPATPAELASGIRAGKAVIRAHFAAPPTTGPARPLARFWRMGLLQSALGVMLTWFVLELVAIRLDGFLQSLVK